MLLLVFLFTPWLGYSQLVGSYYYHEPFFMGVTTIITFNTDNKFHFESGSDDGQTIDSGSYFIKKDSLLLCFNHDTSIYKANVSIENIPASTSDSVDIFFNIVEKHTGNRVDLTRIYFRRNKMLFHYIKGDSTRATRVSKSYFPITMEVGSISGLNSNVANTHFEEVKFGLSEPTNYRISIQVCYDGLKNYQDTLKYLMKYINQQLFLKEINGRKEEKFELYKKQ